MPARPLEIKTRARGWLGRPSPLSSACAERSRFGHPSHMSYLSYMSLTPAHQNPIPQSCANPPQSTRSVPQRARLGRRLNPAKSPFFEPANQPAPVWRRPKAFPLRQPLAPSPPRFSGGAGRGAAALLKTSTGPSRRFKLWFVGSIVKTPETFGGQCPKLRLSLLFLLVTLLVTLALPARAERLTTNLPTGWQFIFQDVDPAAPTTAWTAVTLPHTWNTVDALPADPGHPRPRDGYLRGAGWYARTLDVPATWSGQRVFIRFEAASIVATVYLNGEPIGSHRGAFTAFCFELTPHLHFGQKNELRVRVDNSPVADIPPLSGDFNMDGGLYRPVALIVTDPVCVTPLDSASPGVYETIQSLDDQYARVEIKSLIANGATTPQSPQVETLIQDATGAVITQQTQTQTLPPSQTVPNPAVLEIPRPHRWNGRPDPYLYTVTVRLRRGDAIVDEVTQPLGLRTVAITEAQGFLLNDQPYPIHGVSRHQDEFGKGWALTAADHQADARLILDLGATAVRNTHYPQSGTWHDLADHNGLLLWDEISLVRTINASPAFAAGSELEAREMILQLYNHPAIAFWGLFNELDNLPTPPPGALLTHLKSVVQELDPSRLIVAATDHFHRSYNLIPDWTCYNTYPGWYGTAVTPGPDPVIDQIFTEIGHRTALSEYGAGGNPFQHQEGPVTWRGGKMANNPVHPEEYQAAVHEADYAQIVDNPKLWGSFVWSMFDFASATKHEGGLIGVNDKGLMTQDRAVKKDAYYFYQANWTTTPMLHLASRRLTPRTEPVTTIKIYSNLPAVQLTVNGHELPAVLPDRVHVFRWENVTLQPGDNQIAATATAHGQTLRDHCTWVLQPPPTSPN